MKLALAPRSSKSMFDIGLVFGSAMDFLNDAEYDAHVRVSTIAKFRGPLKCKDQKFRVSLHSKMPTWYNRRYHRTGSRWAFGSYDIVVSYPFYAAGKALVWQINRWRLYDPQEDVLHIANLRDGAKHDLVTTYTGSRTDFAPSFRLRLPQYAIHVGAQVLMHGAVLLASH